MKILGHQFKLVYRKKLKTWGRCHFKAGLIKIKPGLIKTHQETTILHETMEALRYYLQIEISHDDLSRFEAGLYQALTDNGVDLSPLSAELDKED